MPILIVALNGFLVTMCIHRNACTPCGVYRDRTGGCFQ